VTEMSASQMVNGLGDLDGPSSTDGPEWDIDLSWSLIASQAGGVSRGLVGDSGRNFWMPI